MLDAVAAIVDADGDGRIDSPAEILPRLISYRKTGGAVVVCLLVLAAVVVTALGFVAQMERPEGVTAGHWAAFGTVMSVASAMFTAAVYKRRAVYDYTHPEMQLRTVL